MNTVTNGPCKFDHINGVAALGNFLIRECMGTSGAKEKESDHNNEVAVLGISPIKLGST